MKCVFCEIVAGNAPASVIYQDAWLMAFMTLRPTAPGECLIIPKAHVDHFTDLDDDMSRRIMSVAQRIGRRLRHEFKPLRVGIDRKSIRLNSSHLVISYAVFCLKKKNQARL